MKKYFSLIAFAMLAVFCLAFVSCGDDDDEGGENSSALVGTWDAVSSRFYDDDGWEETEAESWYWVFTDKTVTVYDEDDMFDGKTVKYKYDGKNLTISGMPIWTVITLNSSVMVLKANIIGGYQETTFRKRK